MSTIASRLSLRGRLPSIRLSSGISAIIVKELRGRMRGRRAFVIVTIHVLILALVGWMLMRLNEEMTSNFGFGGGFGGNVTFASAAIGRGIFIGLMLLQTLMVAVLAPAATAGAISSEREHQTLDLLTVTPISSLAIVLGKLISALAWLFVLILASIPVTSLVFVFGGVAPDDVLRGYIVLFATVIGLGSVGIFFSTLTRRTGASTGLTFVVTLILVVGSIFVWAFWTGTSESDFTGRREPPPEALLYLNPFVAQMDVACGTEEGGFGNACGFMSGITGQTQQFAEPDFPRAVPAVKPGIGGAVDDGVVVLRGGGVNEDGEVVVAQVADPWRDRFWPKSALSFLFLAAVMTLASVQFVTPTRRWRPSLPGPVRRLIRRRSA
ncbi:MAG: ABC transporter permease [Chloroflexi bacterium]|nr:ABC transporter permease [Chloroflexota bacterium]